MSRSSTDTLFLNLLSAAIWDKPADAALFKGLDAKSWNAITTMAQKQSVSALIANKALSLPKESLAPKEQNLKFMVQIKQTESLNRKMIGVLADLVEEYQEAGFQFCLLKGLSNGVNYPSPLLRNPGDLDLFLYRKGDYESSKKWITGKGIKIDDGVTLHYKYLKENIWIEIHRRITYFDHKKSDSLFKKLEAELIEKENFLTIEIKGAPQGQKVLVKQLPIELNALFIFQHKFRHFAHSGVGFRQFCDWLLFLSKHRAQIDKESFTALANTYSLLYPMQVFARVAVKYLDAPQAIFPFEMIPDCKHVEWVIKDILESGNFGFHRSGKKRPTEKYGGMWFSYKTIIKRSLKFGQISPKHSAILPATRLINRLKIGFNV